MKVSLPNIRVWLIQIVIILFLILPFHFQFLKLAIILAIITLTAFNHELRISSECLYWNAIYILFNAVYIAFSFIYGNPGVSHYIPTYVIWPLLFMILSGCIQQKDLSHIYNCIRLCVWIIIVSGVFSFVLFNVTQNTTGSTVLFEAGIRPGFPFIAISSPDINSFIFWYFYLFSILYLTKQPFSVIGFILIVSGIIFIFGTSRRVLYLNFAIALAFVAYSVRFLKKKDKPYFRKRIRISFCLILAFIALSIYILLNNGLLEPDSLTDFFEKTSEASDAPRIEQTKALLDGWLENPYFGAGTGINASVSRSEIPGFYELSYHAKLFETGFFGFLIYASLWCILFYWVYKLINKDFIPIKYTIALLTSMTIFMLSNATNPYLAAFDYLWYMYVPFVFINISKRENGTRRHSACII